MIRYHLIQPLADLDSTSLFQILHISEIVEPSGKAENFVAQVEAIGYARHRNLVKLLGYSTEGAFRYHLFNLV